MQLPKCLYDVVVQAQITHCGVSKCRSIHFTSPGYSVEPLGYTVLFTTSFEINGNYFGYSKIHTCTCISYGETESYNP